MRRRPFLRGWAVLWTALQFALPAAVNLADARLEGESAGGAVTHVEAASGRTYRPVHPAKCALCLRV
jgi:hypothetical protein